MTQIKHHLELWSFCIATSLLNDSDRMPKDARKSCKGSTKVNYYMLICPSSTISRTYQMKVEA